MPSLARASLLALAVMPAAAQDKPPAPATPFRSVLDASIERTRPDTAKDDIWQDRTTWENAWRAQSAHVEVRTTKSHGFARSLANGLESMLEHFQTTLGIQRLPSRRISVFVLPDIATYNQFGDDHGEHHSSFFGAFYAAGHEERPVCVVHSDNVLLVQWNATHALLHAYVAQTFPSANLPVWLSEGLAAYFSAFWNYGWAVDQLEAMRGTPREIPLRRLLGDPLQSYGDRPQERLIQLGMFVDYLLRFRPETRTQAPGDADAAAPFRDYIVDLLEGRTPDRAAVDQITGGLDELQEQFRAFEFPRD